MQISSQRAHIFNSRARSKIEKAALEHTLMKIYREDVNRVACSITEVGSFNRESSTNKIECTEGRAIST